MLITMSPANSEITHTIEAPRLSGVLGILWAFPTLGDFVGLFADRICDQLMNYKCSFKIIECNMLD